MMCSDCGGTGDLFDNDADDWVSPWEPCQECNGSGEVDE